MKTSTSNFENEHPAEAQLVLALDQELEQQAAAAIARHLEQCGACQAHWDQLRRVSEQITECHSAIRSGTLRVSSAIPDAPPRFGKPVRVASIVGAAAAALSIVAIAIRSGGPAQTSHSEVAKASQNFNRAPAPLRSPFGNTPALPSRKRKRPAAAQTSSIVELPYSDRALPLNDAMVVRVELPIEELRLTGLAVDAGRPGTVVQADVLLGIDGLPRAIRLVE